MKHYQFEACVILLLIVFLFAKCDTEEPHNHHNHQSAQDAELLKDIQDNNQAMSKIDDRTFQTLLIGYLDLNQAMVDSDRKAAQSVASRLNINLTRLDSGNNLTVINKEVEAILEADDIARQREHFKPLSEQLYQLILTNPGQKIPLYKQYCPMAFDGKGAFWLSDNIEIENPYYGQQMLNCGTIQDTLKVNL